MKIGAMMPQAIGSLKQNISHMVIYISSLERSFLLVHSVSEPIVTPNPFSLLFMDYPDVVTVEQLCKMLGDISTKTAYKLLRARRIDHFRIGKTYKIPKQSVIMYLGEIMTPNSLSNTDALPH